MNPNQDVIPSQDQNPTPNPQNQATPPTPTPPPAPAPSPTPNPAPAPSPTPTPQVSSAGSAPQAPNYGAKKKKMWPIVSLAVAAIIAVIATLYVTVYLPTTPKYVLLKSIDSTLHQKNLVLTADFTDNKNGSKSNFYYASNGTNAATKVNIGPALLRIGIELRKVDGNYYLKLSNYTKVAQAVSLISPSVGKQLVAVATQIDSKWFELDAKSVKNNQSFACLNGLTPGLTSADVTQIENIYKKNSFATANSVSNATLDGAQMKRVSVTVDGSTLNNFANALVAQNSQLNKLGQCLGLKGSSIAGKLMQGDKNFNANVDINKSSGLIAQITGGNKANKSASSYVIQMNYSPVTITKPANAVPFSNLNAALTSLLP